MAELHESFPAQAIDHLAKGEKIAAIKIIRVESGLGLKEAKDAAENYIRSQPELAKFYAKRAATGRSAALILAILTALALLVAIRSLR